MRQENLASLGSFKEGLAAASGGKVCGEGKRSFLHAFLFLAGTGQYFLSGHKKYSKKSLFHRGDLSHESVAHKPIAAQARNCYKKILSAFFITISHAFPSHILRQLLVFHRLMKR